MRKSVTVNDRMQQNYRYERVEPAGRNFYPEFKPDLTPGRYSSPRRVRRQVHDRLRRSVPRRVGSSTPSLRVAHATDHSTTLVSMPVSRCRNGAGRDGYTPTIHVAGSNGTAGTTWGDECPTRTLGRSNAGRQSAVMCVSFSLRASLAMSGAAGGNDRRCCTGPTTAGSCEKVENSQVEHRVCIEIRCYLAPQPIWASSKPSNRRPAFAPARVSSRCG
jgi:hypothetical protein